jgi:hypothetical protein
MGNATKNEHLQARRKFLASCGKFALVTPPVISLMLSSSEDAYARTGSGSPGAPAPAATPDAWGNPYKAGSDEWYNFVLSGQRGPESMSPVERNLWFAANGGRSNFLGGLWSFR